MTSREVRITFFAEQRELSVFCHSTSEFVHMPRCSRKTMITSKDTRNYTSSGRSPMSSLRDSSSACSSVECFKVLTMGYARRVKEVGEWRGTSLMESRESVPLEGCLGYLISSPGPGHVQRDRFSRPRGVLSLREGT